MNEPEKRKLYSLDPHKLKFIPMLRPGGRTGAGATTHCVHGKAVAMRETVLDWKPFDYYTVEQDSGPMGIIQVTFRLQPLETGRKTRPPLFPERLHSPFAGLPQPPAHQVLLYARL